MPKAKLFPATEALVLRTFDVGEADRFCILLTPHLGRLAARAIGTRKVGSRLGAVLLPLQHVSLDLEERSSGIAIRGGQLLTTPIRRNLSELAFAQEAVEILLKLTEDAQEFPELFEHCKTFFCGPTNEQTLLPFMLRLFALLGVLPLSMDDVRYASLSVKERAAMHECLETNCAMPDVSVLSALEQFLQLTVQEHLKSPLLSSQVRHSLSVHSR